MDTAVQYKHGLGSFLRMMVDPTYYIRRSLDNSIQENETLLEHIRSFAPGSRWENLERMILSEGAEIQKGLRVWHIPVSAIQLPIKFDLKLEELVTMMFSIAETDVCVRDIHNHMTKFGPKTQTTYIIKGSCILNVHHSTEDLSPIATRYSTGKQFTLRPDEYHTIEIDKGTLMLTIFIPAI